jgi:hypothetical protein
MSESSFVKKNKEARIIEGHKSWRAAIADSFGVHRLALSMIMAGPIRQSPTTT